MSQTERDRPSVLRAARERTRAEITREILDTARRHQATEGASGPSLRAIACEPGWSPAAVYRYVAESVRRWAEQLGFDPVLRDLAAHAGMATARPTAKNAECRSAHLQLAGSPWPWRPATPFAFTIAAAIGVALLPAAAARRHRP